jgi:hypothetical protein
MEENKPVTLAKARLYNKIDEIERKRKILNHRPPSQSPVMPLTALFVFLIVVVVVEEKALYKAEAEIKLMKATIAEQAEVIRISGERILALQSEAQPKRPEMTKPRPVRRRRPRASAQNLDFANGYGRDN